MVLSSCLEKRSRSFKIFVFVVIVILIIIILGIPSAAPQCHRSGPREWSADGYRNFAIRTTWDGQCLDHEPVKISLAPASNGDVTVKVLAPFFDSPGKPDGPPGKPFPQLWDYEVVETFFLNDNDQYLEVELSPHGQHLVLLLNGRRKMVKDKLALSFSTKLMGDRWEGEATIPRSYLPPGVSKFNAYAIHGEGASRQYESLYPLTNPEEGAQPDFHRLEFFQPIDMTTIINNYNSQEVSGIWKEILQ